MPGIIIKNQTFTPENEQYDFYAGSGYIEYLLNSNLHPMEKQDGTLTNENINTMREYMSRTNYFSDRGGLNNLEIFDKYDNTFLSSSEHDTTPAYKSNIYSLVLSFPPELSKNKTFTKEEMHEYAKTLFESVMKANKKWGFDEKYFNYYACVHDRNFEDKEHPNDHTHMHLVIYQPKGTLKKKIVNRTKLSLFGFNHAKLQIANRIDELKEKPEQIKNIFNSKKDLQATFKSKIKNLNDIELWKATEQECDKQLNLLCKTHKQLYKLFKSQPNTFTYIDKKTGQKHEKKGLGIYYDNLLVPIYSLKDLDLISKNQKTLEECKKEIQPEQIIYKKMLDGYANTVLTADEELNNKNKQFLKFCEAYKADRMLIVGGNEKSPESRDSMNKILDYKLNRMVFKDLQTNIGNEIIKTVTSINTKSHLAKQTNTKTSKSGTAKSFRMSKRACLGNVQHLVHTFYSNNTTHPGHLKPIFPNSVGYVEQQLNKLKQEEKLKKLAEEQNITVEELKRRIKK